jgi:hypothetical protein
MLRWCPVRCTLVSWTLVSSLSRSTRVGQSLMVTGASLSNIAATRSLLVGLRGRTCIKCGDGEGIATLVLPHSAIMATLTSLAIRPMLDLSASVGGHLFILRAKWLKPPPLPTSSFYQTCASRGDLHERATISVAYCDLDLPASHALPREAPIFEGEEIWKSKLA